jgi:hypothetical protein
MTAVTSERNHYTVFSANLKFNVARLCKETHVATYRAATNKEMPLEQYLRVQVENWHHVKRNPVMETNEAALRAFLDTRPVRTLYNPNLVCDIDKAMKLDLRLVAGVHGQDVYRQALAEWNKAQQDEPLFGYCWKVYEAYKRTELRQCAEEGDEEEQEEEEAEEEERTFKTAPMQCETPPIDPKSGQRRELGVYIVSATQNTTWDVARPVFKQGFLTRTDQLLSLRNKLARDDTWRCWSADDLHSGFKMIFLCFWTWCVSKQQKRLGKLPGDLDDSRALAECLDDHAYVDSLFLAYLAFLAIVADPSLCIKPSRARTVGAAVAMLVAKCGNEMESGVVYSHVLENWRQAESGLPDTKEVLHLELLLMSHFGMHRPRLEQTGLTFVDVHDILTKYDKKKTTTDEEKKEKEEEEEPEKRPLTCRLYVSLDDAKGGGGEEDKEQTERPMLRSHATWLVWLFRLINTMQSSNLPRMTEFLLSTPAEQRILLNELCLHGEKARKRYDQDRWNVKPLFAMMELT